MNVRSSWRIGHAAIDREARLDRSGRHELQSATDQISADDGVHFSSRRFANRLELQPFSLAPSEIECHEFGADDVGMGSADHGNRAPTVLWALAAAGAAIMIIATLRALGLL